MGFLFQRLRVSMIQERRGCRNSWELTSCLTNLLVSCDCSNIFLHNYETAAIYSLIVVKTRSSNKCVSIAKPCKCSFTCTPDVLSCLFTPGCSLCSASSSSVTLPSPLWCFFIFFFLNTLVRKLRYCGGMYDVCVHVWCVCACMCGFLCVCVIVCTWMCGFLCVCFLRPSLLFFLTSVSYWPIVHHLGQTSWLTSCSNPCFSTSPAHISIPGIFMWVLELNSSSYLWSKCLIDQGISLDPPLPFFLLFS